MSNFSLHLQHKTFFWTFSTATTVKQSAIKLDAMLASVTGSSKSAVSPIDISQLLVELTYLPYLFTRYLNFWNRYVFPSMYISSWICYHCFSFFAWLISKCYFFGPAYRNYFAFHRHYFVFSYDIYLYVWKAWKIDIIGCEASIFQNVNFTKPIYNDIFWPFLCTNRKITDFYGALI